jgi:hypothetical protein
MPEKTSASIMDGVDEIINRRLGFMAPRDYRQIGYDEQTSMEDKYFRPPASSICR